MARLERSPKFSTIRTPPLVRGTRRWTHLSFESGNKVPWIVEDWPDDDQTIPLVLFYISSCVEYLQMLIQTFSHWIYPKTYVVADSIQLYKLLLDSQLSSSKTYDCRSLIVKRASEADIKSIRSILEKPTCRMRGLRNLSHISFGKVSSMLRLS